MNPISILRDGPIATVTLCNPERLNALTKAMWVGLGEAIRALAADDALRCVVLRGAGEQAFAAGADISEFATERADSRQAKAYGELIHETMQAVGRCRHPTVAMIRGACIGGGLEIAAMCDMRICGESSRFGIPINRLGLTMAYGELEGLLALVGRAVTLEILLEGRVFGAAEALAKRLVNRVVPDAKVEEESYALARRIAAGAPLVARWHKRFVERLTVRAQLAPQEWDDGYACFDTEDYRVGVDAFLRKEKPRFQGR
ncbi:MAG TPA: enoyl-CoA hydratase-related protein [Burkholderiales bacterium]|jgi:enoyl-CoA hydratase/carnithine racemase|nr:enoyl-CoA hydratase-related protein [Burkholderiales bacterium]